MREIKEEQEASRLQNDHGEPRQAPNDELLTLPGPRVEFGALVDPLSIQLEKQGFTVRDHAELMRVETIAKAVAIVTIHGLMPPSQSDRARRKLVARLGKIVIPARAERPS